MQTPASNGQPTDDKVNQLLTCLFGKCEPDEVSRRLRTFADDTTIPLARKTKIANILQSMALLYRRIELVFPRTWTVDTHENPRAAAEALKDLRKDCDDLIWNAAYELERLADEDDKKRADEAKPAPLVPEPVGDEDDDEESHDLGDPVAVTPLETVVPADAAA